MKKLLSIVLCSAILFLFQPPVHAADLDDIYTPFIAQDKFLYQAEISSFHMTEEGLHGSASFGDFESDPSLLSVYHSLRFSPVSDFEVEAGYGQFLPREYSRLTYDNPTDVLDTAQKYRLDHFQDYFLNLRLRKGLFETYLIIREKRQKAKVDAVLLLNDTSSFDDITSHYEDFKLGIRYLSEEKTPAEKNNYFQITRPLLEDDQINVEAGLGYRNGRVKNTSDIYWLGVLYIREYFHQLRPHFIPEVLLRYGLSDRVEVETGFSYTTPFKYNYEYKQFDPGDSNFITGTYSIKNDITAPFKISYRPSDSLAVTLSSDFHYTRQRLDMWEKEADDSITSYSPRNLYALNTRPTLELAYFHNADQQISKDELSSFTKQMLKSKQFLLGFQYQKDITSLKKDDNNGAQNVIDPYGLFLYPLDLFVSGTEAGTFFLGNKTTRAAEVQPQNYYDVKTSLAYGLRDYLNVGLEIGYRSGSSLHHFTVQDLADRFYKFEPFYYFTFLADWKVKENSLLSLKAYYVPQHKTFLDTTVHPDQFEAQTQYYAISLAWKILF
ncbi:MAG: hypothetical protein KAR32_00720 [Candidatus Omnitrophica bacterium]|nr:hypothetical protein [Candidatus Omnitrophota bacterium]